jgi:dUTP pyrophosphatase
MGIGVKIKRLHEDAKIPFYATDGSAGCDIYSVEECVIAPGETKRIPTGIAIEVPDGYFFKIEGRSGLSSKGLIKSGGIIDSDYRGEVQVILHNITAEAFKIEKGDRIAQGMLLPISKISFIESHTLSETKRGFGGFQSTGIK